MITKIFILDGTDGEDNEKELVDVEQDELMEVDKEEIKYQLQVRESRD